MKRKYTFILMALTALACISLTSCVKNTTLPPSAEIPADGVFYAGERTQVGGWEVVVDSIKTADAYEVDYYPYQVKPGEGKKFVLVHLTIKNLSKEDAYCNLGSLSASTGSLITNLLCQDIEYEVTAHNKGDIGYIGAILPSQSRSGLARFAVPKDAVNGSFYFILRTTAEREDSVTRSLVEYTATYILTPQE